MKKNDNYNGFASEEQYEAVLEIIRKEINHPFHHFSVYRDENYTDCIKVYVDDFVYWMDEESGVFEIENNSESPKITAYYLCIYEDLNAIYVKIFEAIDDKNKRMKNFNGFASKEQYEAVKKIVFDIINNNKCYDYYNIEVSCSNGSIKVVIEDDVLVCYGNGNGCDIRQKRHREWIGYDRIDIAAELANSMRNGAFDFVFNHNEMED